MQKHHEICDRLIREFVEEHMEKLFYFCLKKTSDTADAEDLTQDIALNILTALHHGTVPANFSAWVWQIARNRYAVWATEKHHHIGSVTGADIGDYEIPDGSGQILDDMIRAEQLSLLRRELAFIRSDYRHIVVAYYIENQTVRDIASTLSLSESAVKQRLHRARIILKEGMDMAREFGKRSYKPEQIAFVQNGMDGKKGQPWSIITHLLYKNIFLEAYENPQTAEELSLELGIALPYMEDELEFLVREQLLRKDGNRYQTDFRIIGKEEQRAVHDANRQIQKPLTDLLCALIDTYIGEDGDKVNIGEIGYESAKWALIVHAFDVLIRSAHDPSADDLPHANAHPARPDDGAWTLTGYEVIDWEAPAFVGLNGYLSYDENEVKMPIEFGQYKFFYRNHQEKTPTHLTWTEVYTLWLVCTGRSEACEKGYLEKMIEYGYLKQEKDGLRPQVVIFHGSTGAPEHEEVTAKLSALRQEIYRLLKQAPDIERGYIVEQALKDGWLTYNDDTAKTIGAYIYL